MTLPAPYPPLVSGGEGLDRYPSDPAALAARMAAIYGVEPESVLPVRGLTHGLELIWRLAARDGLPVQAPEAEPYLRLDAIYGFTSPSAKADREDRSRQRPGGGDSVDDRQPSSRPLPTAAPSASQGSYTIPRYPTRVRERRGEPLAVIVRALGSPEAVAEMAERVAPALLVVDEGVIEFADTTSAATLVGDHANLVVLRSLSLAYGLAGARVGAAIAQATTLARLASVLEPYAIPEPVLRLAQQALDPSRMIETAERVATVKTERARLARDLGRIMMIEAGVGPILMARPSDMAAARTALATWGVASDVSGDRLRLPVSIKAEVNDRMLAALGASGARAKAHRTGQAVRDTKETRIVCAVDLDATGPIRIETGVGFFDHMLEQVAAHGGFSLRLQCEGDLHTDPHHTIEDSAIALGQALKQALGERRGIGRYGFVLPMDEASATVSIDLSGRPYPVFEGTFDTPFIGDYRTDLTVHVFRSLAEHLGAAIHISVTGTDDHHKTEAIYKGFGRALRQAIRVEGDAVPSTKGVL